MFYEGWDRLLSRGAVSYTHLDVYKRQLLGKVRREQHERSEAILNDLCEKIEALIAKLEAEGIEPEAIDILRAPTAPGDPVRALADSLCTMMGDKLLRSKALMFIDSCLMINEAHGVGRKRRVYRSLAGRKRKIDKDLHGRRQYGSYPETGS